MFLSLLSISALCACLGTVLAVGALVLEMHGRLHSKGRAYLLAVGIGSAMLAFRAFMVREPSFLILEAIKTLAAFSALLLPRRSFITELLQDVEAL